MHFIPGFGEHPKAALIGAYSMTTAGYPQISNARSAKTVPCGGDEQIGLILDSHRTNYCNYLLRLFKR